MRTCTKCKRRKTASDFYAAAKGKDGLRAACKKCCNAESLTWQASNRETVNAIAAKYRKNNAEKVKIARKRAVVWKTFGITLEEYRKKLDPGRCEICAKRLPTAARCLDHDHATGKVRGLLCSGCNSGLGFFRDNPELLLAAVTYLEKHANS